MTTTTLLLLAAAVLVVCWAATCTRLVAEGRWTVVTRDGVVRRVHAGGLAWRWPVLDRFEPEIDVRRVAPVGSRAATADGVPLLVLAEATVSVPRPVPGTRYVDPWKVAERAAEDAIARSVTGWAAVELTQTAAAAQGPVRDAVASAVDDLGVRLHELELVEVAIRLDEMSQQQLTARGPD